MKKVKYLAMLLAAGMFAACSDNLEDTGAGNAGGTTPQGETGYVNISLNLPTTSGGNTRANESFDDGLAAEYKVNDAIIALFYGADESTATCRYAFELSSTDFELSGGTTDNITSYYASGVRMIKSPDEGENVYALAILNSTDYFDVTTTTESGEATGDAALSTKLQTGTSNSKKDFTGTLSSLWTTAATYDANIASTSNGGDFLMTNAPISSITSYTSTETKPADLNVTTLAPITVYNDKEMAEGLASANPIYVERAVAKTTVKVNSADGSLTIKSEVPAYDGAKVTFTGEGNGWKLQNTNKSYYYVRKVTDASQNDWDDWAISFNGGVTSEINRFFGQMANPYRTYWGIDPNYDVIASENLATNFNILTNTSSITWNTVGITSTTAAQYTDKYVEYCAENTTKAQAMQDNNLTGVLLKTTFTPEGAQPGDNFFMLNNTSAIFLEDGDRGFIAWATAVLANGSTGIPLDENETLSIKEGAPEGTITTADGVKALLKTSSASPNDELTNDQANAILTAAGSNIKFYKGGVTYYYSTLIEHFGDAQTPLGDNVVIDDLTDYDEKKHLGRWGVVRNNWYELNITSVSGPGEPEIPEIPEKPADKTNSYINCEINVLSWAKRTQGVEL